MKVAQVLYSGLGGHGSVAFSLVNADNESKWQPKMGFLGVEALSDTYVQQCQKKGIEYEYISATEGKPWKSWMKIFSWLKQQQPNAIVLHSINTLLPCWFYARYKNVPLIVVEHTPNIIKRKSEWMASRLAMQLADVVVLLTKEYRDELKQRLGSFYRDSKVEIITNGIDTDRFMLQERPPLEQARTIRLGMAARFSEKKCQNLLIDMLGLLREESESIDYRLTLAGNGEMYETLQVKTKEMGLEEFVDFPGYLGEDEMLEWFGTIDIYLHASEGETLSTSLLQSMSMGLPIIASDVPGISNLLGVEEECGVLVENSGKGFCNAVEALVKNTEQAKQLSSRAREYAVTTYSQNTMFNLYDQLIKENIS